MSKNHCHSSPRPRRNSFASLVAAPMLMGSLLGIFVVAIPMTRSSEINERSTSNERCEELTMTGRCDRVRNLALEYLRVSHVHGHALAVLANIGRSQLPDLDPPAGHRLPNGLLAPLTC